MRDLNTGKYTRVRKDVARRLFNEGETIYLTPSNIAAYESNYWIRPYPIQSVSGIPGVSFDAQVNAFEYYNCNYELGYYTNFWIISE